MGSQISSDVSDLAFYEVVEKHVLVPETLDRFGILRWLRYRDDILVISTDFDGLAAFSSAL